MIKVIFDSSILCILLLIAQPTMAQVVPGLTRCECVASGACYTNGVNNDGGGSLDPRIVSGPTGTGATTSAPTASCTLGKVQCCSECGVSYNITQTPATKPAAGQGTYGGQPWQVALRLQNGTLIGGGVLLDDTHVLTVAHKVFGRIPAGLKVSLGVWDANKNVETFKKEDRNVTAFIVHEQYDNARMNLFNDIAMLKLSAPVKYGPAGNPAINTACLPNANENYDNLRCIVSGWGKNAFNGDMQNIIKEVDVPILTDAVCQSRLQTSPRLGSTFVLNGNSFICAGGEANKDACVGDGGSPLMCNFNGRYRVVGLVSWGIGCATGNIPGVYVQVQSYLDWITKNLKI